MNVDVMTIHCTKIEVRSAGQSYQQQDILKASSMRASTALNHIIILRIDIIKQNHHIKQEKRYSHYIMFAYHVFAWTSGLIGN